MTNNSVNVSLSGQTGTGAFVGSISPTLTTPTATSLQLSTNNALYDSAGNLMLGFAPAVNAVNNFVILNSSTGVNTTFTTRGADTDIGISFSAKAAGINQISTEATSNQIVFLTGVAYAHTTTFNFPSTTAGQTVTFPDISGTVALLDTNNNLSATNFLSGYTTTATAAGTTILTVASTYQQYFTGSSTQTITMPVTSTLVLGQAFYIVNNSSGAVTVQSSGANTIQVMAAGSTMLITCIVTSGTTAASWNIDYQIIATGVTSITGTANQVIASAATGAVTLSLPQSIATSSAPTFQDLTITRNATANNFAPATSPIVLIGGSTTLTNTSTQIIIFGGSGGTCILPDATTLVIGWQFYFHNNTSGSVVIEQNGGATLATMLPGSYMNLTNLTIAIPAGTWAYSWDLPQNAAYGTSGLTVTGQVTATAGMTANSLAFNPTTNGIVGTTVGDVAAAGYVGEVISSTVLSTAAFSLPNNANTNLTSITLTPGDWLVSANVAFRTNGSTNPSVQGWTSTTSTGFTDDAFSFCLTEFSATITASYAGSTATLVYNVTTPTTVYLVVFGSATGGTMTSSGTIVAQRFR